MRMNLLTFLEARVGSRELAEDVLQTAFVRGIERGHAIRRDESIVAWFYALLSNSLVDAGRRRAAEARALAGFRREVDLHVAIEPEVHRQVCLCVGRLLGTLKLEYGRAVSTVDLQGKPLNELARRERISANAAAVRLHRARRALARRVRAVCGPCADRGCVDCTCPRPGEATRS